MSQPRHRHTGRFQSHRQLAAEARRDAREHEGLANRADDESARHAEIAQRLENENTSAGRQAALQHRMAAVNQSDIADKHRKLATEHKRLALHHESKIEPPSHLEEPGFPAAPGPGVGRLVHDLAIDRGDGGATAAQRHAFRGSDNATAISKGMVAVRPMTAKQFFKNFGYR